MVVQEERSEEEGENNKIVRCVADEKPAEVSLGFRHPERIVCIACDRPGGAVLVCRGKNCPLAFHEGCVKGDPSFDENGGFYCPFCWYRVKLERVEETRERVLLAERYLLEFLNCKVGEGLDVLRVGVDGDNVRDVLSEGVKENTADGEQCGRMDEAISCGGGTDCRDDVRKLVRSPCKETDFFAGEEKVSGTHQLGILGEGVAQEVAGENNERVENVNQEGGDNENEANRQDVNFPAQQEKKLECDSGSDVSGTDTETLSVRITRAKLKALEAKKVENVNSPRKSPQQAKVTKDGNAKNRSKKSDAPKRLYITEEGSSGKRGEDKVTRKRPKLVQGSPEKCSSTAISDGRRKKLLWTTEEEDMLKEGVERYSNATNKNIPWRKILDFGHHVFDSTRTPVDLKDKWRNMLFRDSPQRSGGSP